MTFKKGFLSESIGGSGFNTGFSSGGTLGGNNVDSSVGGYSGPTGYTNTLFGNNVTKPTTTTTAPVSSGSPSGQVTTQNTSSDHEALLKEYTALLGQVNALSLPTNLDTGTSFTPGSRITRNYNYGGGTNMLEFLKKKSQGLGLDDPLGGFDAFKFMGAR